MRSVNTLQTGEKTFDLLEATAALACTKGRTPLAVQAKSGIGKFYENLERGIYKELFNPSISGYYVFNSVQVVRVIETVLKQQIEKLDKKSGRRYGILVHGNRIIEMLTIANLNLNSQLVEMSFQPDVNQLETKAIEIYNDLNTVIETYYPDSFLATLFKNSSKCAHLVSQVSKV